MAWYNNIFTKLNPVQPSIGGGGEEHTKENKFNYKKAYQELEVVNRGVNMIVDDASEIPVRVGGQRPGDSVRKGMRQKELTKLLNYEPNPFQDVSDFKRNILTDYLIDGNIFIYYDGKYIYHQPADKMTIVPSETTYVKGYKFDGDDDITFKPEEIIHIRENSFDSIYRGTSRLRSAVRTMALMTNMRNFQDNFFKNGAVPGLVLKSPNTLSEKIKARMIASWMDKYRPDSGGKRPLILDGGIEVASISNVNFQQLDFQASIADNEKIILKALGVPPILLDTGNNANIRPNLRMYYLETILSITHKINKGYERFFGFTITDDITDIPALQPELSDQANYFTTLVNGGIITPNEARDGLGKEADKDPSSDELRIPANIAGSAADPSEGGRPEEQGDDE